MNSCDVQSGVNNSTVVQSIKTFFLNLTFKNKQLEFIPEKLKSLLVPKNSFHIFCALIKDFNIGLCEGSSKFLNPEKRR